jgi:3-oxoadipate enol-lactonase
MAYANNAGARLYWEVGGSGEPLLLIQGLGWSADMWFRLLPEIEPRYRVIRYDARGIGRSDVPPGPYSIELMAADAMAILDAAGEARAHVCGVSLGGIVAQEVAISFADRVRSLLLGCTHTAGPDAVWPEPKVMEMLKTRTTMSFEEAVRAGIQYGYDPSTSRERVEEDIQRRLALPTTAEGYSNQLLAGLGYPGTRGRLAQISVPTLVLTGDRDRLVPAVNSEILAREIAGARLVVIPGAGHVMFTDQPEAVTAAMLQFLDSVGPLSSRSS